MTWQMIKSVVNIPCIKKTISSMFVNNIQCTDENLIAQGFGKLFFRKKKTGTPEAEITQTSFDPLSLIPINSESIFLNSVSASEFEIIIE